MDSMYPEISVVCTGCGEELRVPPGTQVPDVLWLHERRCEKAATQCPACESKVRVPMGLDAQEALWLHADECAESDAAFGFAS